MVSLINACFSTIYTLYSEVMKLAGITVAATEMEEKALCEIKGGFTEVGQAGISGYKES